MIDEQVILTIERMRDSLEDLLRNLRRRYTSPNRQVTADDLKSVAASLAETWMVNISQRKEIVEAIAPDYRANLTVHFQRLLTFSERSSIRSRYEEDLKAILSGFSLNLIIPIKKLRVTIIPSVSEDSGSQDSSSPTLLIAFQPTAFVGHSFAPADSNIANSIIQCLEAIGIGVLTGEKPRADRISDKVKRLIVKQYLFVGIFSRKDKISHKKEWTTSPWVIDEKAYAVGRNKKLILFKEKDVGSIGGIQGDYEYIEFSRDNIQDALVDLIQMFDLSAQGLRE